MSDEQHERQKCGKCVHYATFAEYYEDPEEDETELGMCVVNGVGEVVGFDGHCSKWGNGMGYPRCNCPTGQQIIDFIIQNKMQSKKVSALVYDHEVRGVYAKCIDKMMLSCREDDCIFICVHINDKEKIT